MELGNDENTGNGRGDDISKGMRNMLEEDKEEEKGEGEKKRRGRKIKRTRRN